MNSFMEGTMRVRFNIDKNADNGRSPYSSLRRNGHLSKGIMIVQATGLRRIWQGNQGRSLVFPEKALKGRIPFSALR
jgi:hypothetical protein